MNSKIKFKLDTKKLSLCGMFIALITVCSWISIPIMAVPITLQTFAVALCAYVLGVRYGLFTISGYLLLGMIGVPVFANFNSGFGAIVGATGGYLIGFLPMCLIIGLSARLCKERIMLKILAGCVGMIVCYAIGTAWFVYVYSVKSPITFGAALSLCVMPFVVFDAIKIYLAAVISKRLAKQVLKENSIN